MPRKLSQSDSETPPRNGATALQKLPKEVRQTRMTTRKLHPPKLPPKAAPKIFGSAPEFRPEKAPEKNRVVYENFSEGYEFGLENGPENSGAPNWENPHNAPEQGS